MMLFSFLSLSFFRAFGVRVRGLETGVSGMMGNGECSSVFAIDDTLLVKLDGAEGD